MTLGEAAEVEELLLTLVDGAKCPLLINNMPCAVRGKHSLHCCANGHALSLGDKLTIVIITEK